MKKRVGTNKAWPMDDLQKALFENLAKDEKFKALTPKKQTKVFLKITKDVAKDIAEDLLSRSPKMLTKRRNDFRKFEAKNLGRWRKAFDLLETIWVCSAELGGNFNRHFRPEAVEFSIYQFEAVTAIHAKSLLVVSEMICLMKGGFPDAALTRWRTLHELNVTALLLIDGGSELSLRYLAHADVQAAKDLDPEDMDGDDVREVLSRAGHALEQFGDELKNNYGWASQIAGKKRPTFEDLEKIADKSVGRSIYKEASQHIHSNHRRYDALLGASEVDGPLLLVGQSDSGMSGPLILASMALTETTSLYLMMNPNFDRTIYVQVLLQMANRLRKAANGIERRGARRIEKRRAKTKAVSQTAPS